jgi:hypothetical protein
MSQRAATASREPVTIEHLAAMLERVIHLLEAPPPRRRFFTLPELEEFGYGSVHSIRWRIRQWRAELEASGAIVPGCPLRVDPDLFEEITTSTTATPERRRA